jgi:hypothetical protein
MAKKRKAAPLDLHARRYAAIKPFVSFRFKAGHTFTEYEKRKLKTYADEIQKLTARTYKTYKPKDPAVLKAAQEFAQHDRQLKGLNVAFVPVANPADAVIKVSKRKGARPQFTVVESSSEYGTIQRASLPFNPRKLAKDSDAHVAETLAQAPPEAKYFNIQAGEYEIANATIAPFVAAKVRRLMSLYSVGGERYQARKGRNSNHWKNWLHGLNAYTFPDQKSAAAYGQAKADANKKLQVARKKQRKSIRDAKRRAAAKRGQ